METLKYRPSKIIYIGLCIFSVVMIIFALPVFVVSQNYFSQSAIISALFVIVFTLALLYSLRTLIYHDPILEINDQFVMFKGIIIPWGEITKIEAIHQILPFVYISYGSLLWRFYPFIRHGEAMWIRIKTKDGGKTIIAPVFFSQRWYVIEEILKNYWYQNGTYTKP
jgi:hypothetical protein